MKFLILVTYLLSFTFLSFGQTKIFKTVDEYVNGTGEVMDSVYGNYSVGNFGHVLMFKNLQGEKVKYSTDDIWGFLFRGRFFRSVGKREIAMLMDTGRVNYYLNGYVAIESLLHPERQVLTIFSGEVTCFLSVGDRTAEIYRMPTDKYQKLDYKKFKTAFPDLDDLYDCFKFTGNIYEIPYNIRDCVKEYNNTKIKKKK